MGARAMVLTAASDRTRARAVAEPPRRTIFMRLAVAAWALIVCCCALGAAAVVWAPRSAASPATPAATASPWRRIVDPLPLFDLSDTAFGRAPNAYEAWRAVPGPGRRDALTFGVFASDAGYLRLSIEQPEPHAPAPQPFFAAIARQAAFAGLAVDKSAAPDGLPTRFGLFTIADATLSASSRGRACLAFRLVDPDLRFSGLACGAKDQPFGRAEFACAIDRLDLLGGAQDSPLASFFTRSELNRGRGCAGDRLVPVKAATSWLDAGHVLPPLKTDRKLTRARRRFPEREL